MLTSWEQKCQLCRTHGKRDPTPSPHQAEGGTQVIGYKSLLGVWKKFLIDYLAFLGALIQKITGCGIKTGPGG